MKLIFPSWQVRYFAAVSERSQEYLSERVTDAETAILVRLEKLWRTCGRDLERQAINEALDALYMIKRNKLNFPGPGQGAISLL
jgi:endo-1,4-beta-mannosidase